METVRFIRGCDGDVEIDALTRLVTKTYLHPRLEQAVNNARREVAYASRFFDALSGIEGLASPKIVGCELAQPPRVVMERCPGARLLDFLAHIDGRDARIPYISGRVCVGLEIYIRLFGEPYYDFCFNNMLFDQDRGVVTLLDFVIPEGAADVGQATLLEASLGWLVGCACYELVRPSFLASSSRTSAHVALMQAVVSGFEGRVSIERVRARAEHALTQMSSAGGRLRRNYYRTVGSLVTRSILDRVARTPLDNKAPRHARIPPASGGGIS